MIAPLATPLVRSLALPLFRQGGGGDFPSLDLAFALDRSFTTDPAAAGAALIPSRRGPAAKFSRGTGATQVNAAGLIEYAPENLLTRSEEFNDAIWDAATQRSLTVTANDTASPSGAANADRLTVGSGSAVYQVIQNIPSPSGTLTSGTTYTVSAFFKPNQVTRVSIWAGNTATLPVDAMFDLTGSGSVVANAFGTASIQQYPNGWYRCVITGTAAATFSTSLRISPVSGTSRTYPGNSVDSFYAWGAQLERASTARTYYPTTTSAFYGPRFDYDPATGASKGLLIEETRTNLVERSEAFNDAYWTKAGGIVTAPVVTADQVNSPSGVQSADRIVFPAVAGTNAFSLVFREFTQAAGVSTTQSIYLRGLIGGEKIWIMWTPNGTTYVRKECVLTTSWQRFDVTYTSTSGLNYFQFGVDLRDASQSAQLTQTIFAWGAQLEAGAFPTSYIPTTSGTAARSADVCSIIGDAFSSFYNQSEGSVVCRAVNANGIGTVTQYPWSMSDSGINNMIVAFRGVSSQLRQCRFASFVSGSDQLSDSPNAGLLADNADSAIGFAIKLNDFAGSLDGNLITDNTVTLPTVDRMFIGSRVDGTRHWGGHIARIQYFRKRLSNSKLQTLTAP